MFATLDNFLVQSLAGNSQTSILLIWFGIFSAKFLLYFIPFHVVVLWLVGGAFGRRVSLTIVISIAIALLIGYLISLGFYRERPFVAGLVEVLIHHARNASFPSNHATITAAYFGVLYMLNYKFAAKCAFCLMVLVCWGRIFVGVHYPTDILAGLGLGFFCAVVATRFILPNIPTVLLVFPVGKSKKEKHATLNKK